MINIPFVLEDAGKAEVGAASAAVELALVVLRAERARKPSSALLGSRHPSQTLFLTRFLWPLYLVRLSPQPSYAVFDATGLHQTAVYLPSLSWAVELERYLEQAELPKDSATTSAAGDVLHAWERRLSKLPAVKPYILGGVVRSLEAERREVFRDTPGGDPLAGDSVTLPLAFGPESAADTLTGALQVILTTTERNLQRARDAAAKLQEAVTRWVGSVEEQRHTLVVRYTSDIASLSSEIHKTVEELQQRAGDEIAAIEARHAAEITALERQWDHWQHEEDQLRQHGAAYREAYARVRQSRQEVQGRLRSVIGQRDREIKSVVSLCSKLIKRESGRVRSLEQERDSALHALDKSKKRLIRVANRLNKRLANFPKRLESCQQASAQIGLPPPEGFGEGAGTPVVTVVLPVWIAAFLSSGGTRFHVMMPATFGARSRLQQVLRWPFGGPVTPMRPRAVSFDRSFGRRLAQELEQQTPIRDKIVELGITRTILANPRLRTLLDAGLKELTRRKWVTLLRAKELLEVAP